MVDSATLGGQSLRDLRALQTSLSAGLGGCSSLEAAAQKFASHAYEKFKGTLPLVRVYAWLPYEDVADDVKKFVHVVADAKGIANDIHPKTGVLTLLGTRGTQPAWNDRRKSTGHVGIPLASATFINSIPMLARLMQEMGVKLDWTNNSRPGDFHRVLGSAGLFYVESASVATDDKGRKIIPAQDFVAANNVRTVFAIGGSYFDGTFVTAIFFTTEAIERMQAQRFISLINVFKAATGALLGERKFFGP